jgi:hypothetical protein
MAKNTCGQKKSCSQWNEATWTQGNQVYNGITQGWKILQMFLEI